MFALIAFFSALLIRLSLPHVLYMEERVMMLSVPSSARAFQYGQRHFSSRNETLYDIETAEYFFREADKLDPMHPQVLHELARLAFLRGDFGVALSRINAQIQTHGDALPNSYYVRGLILGYMGRYEEAARDYEAYLESDPHNWAAVNDYAWVLLKAGRAEEALAAIEPEFAYWPDNPWLLNSAAIAAYELGEHEKAQEYIERATEHVQTLTRREWLVAYPGNDPRIAGDGIAALKKSILNNMHTITSARDDSAVQ